MSSDRHDVFGKLLIRARGLRHENWDRVTKAVDNEQAPFVGEGIHDTGDASREEHQANYECTHQKSKRGKYQKHTKPKQDVFWSLNHLSTVYILNPYPGVRFFHTALERCMNGIAHDSDTDSTG